MFPLCWNTEMTKAQAQEQEQATASVLGMGPLTLPGLCHAHTLPLRVHIHS